MLNSEQTRLQFAQRLNKILDYHDYPQRGRAQKLLNTLNLDISDRAVNKWLKGETMPDRPNMMTIAKEFDVSYDWLASGMESDKPTLDDLRREIEKIQNRGVLSDGDMIKIKDAIAVAIPINEEVPVIDWVAAGSWREANAVMVYDAMEYLPRPLNFPDNGFALRVLGVSMLPKFEPGDYIFVNPNYGFLELKSGDLVVVRENGNDEATFKQLILGETSSDMYLKPLNPDWPEQKMTPKSDWELVGKVVGKWVVF